jgi:hypothetical protein
VKTFQTIALIPIAALTLTLTAGCNEDSNPLAPNTQQVTVKTPVSIRINQLAIEEYPTKKTNGDEWDTKNPLAPQTARPDFYATLGTYKTKVATNAQGGERLDWDGRSYVQLNYENEYTFKYYDEDGILGGADDFIDQCSWSPEDYYKNDEADSVNFFVYGNRGTKVLVKATWIYDSK